MVTVKSADYKSWTQEKLELQYELLYGQKATSEQYIADHNIYFEDEVDADGNNVSLQRAYHYKLLAYIEESMVHVHKLLDHNV